LLQWEHDRFDTIVYDIFGYNALQIGLPKHDFLRSSRIAHHFSCDVEGDVDVRASAYALPFESASIDLVVLPHVLEFSRRPHEVLREVERVLVPDGSVLVAGINPFSLFGLRRAFSRSSAAPPWQGHYFSAPRIKDWMTLLGFETRPCEFGCYAPPFRSQRWLDKMRVLERAGGRWWRVCGAVFVLHGVKRVHGMRLITPKWQTIPAGKALAPFARGRGVQRGRSEKNKQKTQ